MTSVDINYICYAYKHAVEPEKMERILADLYQCRVADIEDLLRLKGIEIQTRNKRWSDEMDIFLLRTYLSGGELQAEFQHKFHTNYTVARLTNRKAYLKWRDAH